MKSTTKSWRVIGLLLCGMAVGVAGGVHAAEAAAQFPYRIGVLADSQITSLLGTFNYGMRRKMADRVASVAIRPPAVEYLAPLMLQRFLDEMKKQKVDLILYLGDGVNSGCTDELNKFFGVLEQARADKGPPSYFVMGNHDYLGTGNQTRMAIRSKLCAADGVINPPETKEQVIKRMELHNKASAAMDTNFALATETVRTGHTASKKCPGDDTGQYTTYHVGVLKSKTGTPVDILLADSSDYRDVTFKANAGIGCEGIGVWGAKGSMSFGTHDETPSQISTLQKMANPDAKYRLVVSHYWPANMNMLLRFNSSGSLLRDDMIRLMAKGQKNVWISGHTHIDAPVTDIVKVGETLSKDKGVFDALNVGSTTDFHPHGLIVGPYRNAGDKPIRESSLGFTTIAYPMAKADCDKVDALAGQSVDGLQPICTNKAVSALGMDRTYRLPCFEESSGAVARSNIDKFSTKAAPALGMAEDDVKACLALRGSHNERLGTDDQPKLRRVPKALYAK